MLKVSAYLSQHKAKPWKPSNIIYLMPSTVWKPNLLKYQFS